MAEQSLTADQKENLVQQLQLQVALESAQKMLGTMTDACFKKCVPKPGSTLDSSETKCVNLCMDRYLDSQNLVMRTFASRLQTESYSGNL